jgi:regulator of nucleoside diphosphate kinase
LGGHARRRGDIAAETLVMKDMSTPARNGTGSGVSDCPPVRIRAHCPPAATAMRPLRSGNRIDGETTTIPGRQCPDKHHQTSARTNAMTTFDSRDLFNTKPPLVLCADDFERLSSLVSAAMNTFPDLAAELAEELERARVLSRGKYPEHVVCMDMEVDFREEASGRVQTVRLVYPEHADISAGKISVLTPVGTALIGVGKGQSVSWETPTGQIRSLTVLDVRHPTE